MEQIKKTNLKELGLPLIHPTLVYMAGQTKVTSEPFQYMAFI